MKRLIVLLSSLLIIGFGTIKAQNEIHEISVKDLAEGFGIRQIYLDDTAAFSDYINHLPAYNHARTDSCVTFNARLQTFINALRHDYNMKGDTIWVDASTRILDYPYYRPKIDTLSRLALRLSFRYMQQENMRKDAIQQTELKAIKDSISRMHRSIVNACDGIGVTDKVRQKELKDIYYAYLSVYNRYDFSMKRSDENYIVELTEFQEFQNHLLKNLLSPNNYSVRINNFSNKLKLRTAHAHGDVFKSYQRVFHWVPTPINFATLDEYYLFVTKQEEILDIQDCYITTVELLEMMDANSQRIVNTYTTKYRNVATTYKEVAASIVVIPTFVTLNDAHEYLNYLREFIMVQEHYISDYNRIMEIVNTGNTIVRQCTLNNSDIAKAYKTMASTITITPTYRTLDDVVRYSQLLDNFELLQRQYSGVITLRKVIEERDAKISHHWAAHHSIYNGYLAIKKQYVTSPTFVTPDEGNRFLENLQNYVSMQDRCLYGIETYYESERLADTVMMLAKPYSNIRTAFNRLKKAYIFLTDINHMSDLDIYIEERHRLLTAENSIIEKLKKQEGSELNTRLKGIKDIDLIELAIGL